MTDQERLDRLCMIISKGHELNQTKKTLKVLGYQFNYYKDIYGEFNLYYFAPLVINEMIAPLNSESANQNRPGTIKESTMYICVHDTASAAETADALAHAKYVSNGGGGTSWHYSCGDDAIYHQIPDNEVAYHAGDGTAVKLKYTDTGVKATSDKPFIEIIDDYFYFNGIKSLIKAPTLEVKNDNGVLKYYSEGAYQGGKVDVSSECIIPLELKTSHINDQSLKTIIGENGNYYLGPVYYNRGFGYVANRCGNLNSIGIETMVNKGSNPLVTWHNCAKLVAKLLVDNNLGLDDVKPHHYFSGKPCPNTMRTNHEWDHFKQMVEIEYEILKLMTDDTTITFKSDLNTKGGIVLDDVSGYYKYDVEIKVGSLRRNLSFMTKFN